MGADLESPSEILGHAAFRRPGPDSAPVRSLTGQPTPEPLRRREQARLARVAVPAAAALVTAALSFAGIGTAVAFAFAVALSSAHFARHLYPRLLMPAARALFAAAGPLLIAAGLAVLAALEPGALGASPSAAILPGLVTAAAAVLADLLGERWTRARPVRVAVIGSPTFAVGLQHELTETGARDVECVGWLNAGGELLMPGEEGHGSAQSIRAAIDKHRIDVIIKGHASGREELAFGGGRAFNRVAEACLDMPVRMVDGNQFYEEQFGHVPIGTMDSAWYLFIKHPRFRPTSPALKRGLDLTVATLASFVAVPVMLLAAVAIKLQDGGPVLFRQRRIGEGGTPFEILKLRTMSVPDGHASARWASADDSRITPVGRFLRRTHIDELPQILNVLRGEMTLVGPRPEQPEIVADLERALPHYSRRHLVKPGVTGWAQVRCGYAGTMLGTAWKSCHDLFYLKHSSLLTDLLIIFETLVIAARDAHRPMRAPESQFLVARDLGLDLSAEAAVYEADFGSDDGAEPAVVTLGGGAAA